MKILLVEDDELFRLGLRVALQQEGIDVLAEASDGETAVQLAQQLPIDVVVLDVGLPGIGGIEACRQILQAKPQLPILILTSRAQKSLIAQLIEAGAKGYCLKGIEAKVLILALRSLAAGASWWDQSVTGEIQAAFQRNFKSSPESTPNSLTKREQEILVLITEGKTNHEIADILYIAPGTVRVHVHTILHKLGVSDRAQAAIFAFQNGLI
ncbi:response regulator transcription factor [Tumidithrix elongata RA019]|uniref:Response regulator transcription factor n=1 Tax=Tumidithrix elongata BACA0141 TaxID=2716417 RepID=A0AAW9PRJ7_9CYAN|nr:response regulator transcription factor [Tumidithrix elongata RA019]